MSFKIKPISVWMTLEFAGWLSATVNFASNDRQLMYLKDYFNILELEPSASQAEIKAAYRRLAQQYHPDKTSNDPYATARFNDIKEAYENLSSPWKKELYLQQRWYVQSTGRKRRAVTIDPVNVLKQSLELERYVDGLDVHRMDKNGLYEYIAELINDDTIQKLAAFDEPRMKEQIAAQLIRSSTPLTAAQFNLLSARIWKLSDSPVTSELLKAMQKKLTKEERWHHKLPLVVLVIAIAVCILIFLLNRN